VAIEISTLLSLHHAIVIDQDPSVFHTDQIGTLNGNVTEITNPKPFKLMVALISEITP
jgi:hypothetical protein